jgi:hypothetical protein
VTSVTLRQNESQDQLLKRFRKKVAKSGILSTVAASAGLCQSDCAASKRRSDCRAGARPRAKNNLPVSNAGYDGVCMAKDDDKIQVEGWWLRRCQEQFKVRLGLVMKSWLTFRVRCANTTLHPVGGPRARGDVALRFDPRPDRVPAPQVGRRRRGC